jgi:hypothetical protein
MELKSDAAALAKLLRVATDFLPLSPQSKIELSDRALKLCGNFLTSELANISHASTITEHTPTNLKIIKPVIPNIVAFGP